MIPRMRFPERIRGGLRNLLEADVIKTDAAIMLLLLTSDTYGMTPSQISMHLGIAAPVCTMAVKRITAKEFLENRYPVRDLRSVNVYLTPAGSDKALKDWETLTGLLE